MIIAVIGAGVIGSLYAGKLAVAGHEVRLVARGRRLKELEDKGLLLHDEVTGRIQRPRLSVAGKGDPTAPYDFALLAVRRDQLAEALVAASALKGAKAFVTMVNLADGGAAAAKVLGAQRLVMGFPGAGGSVKEDGTVAYRIVSPSIQRTTFGEALGGVSERARRLARACAAAGFPSAVSADMASWQRSHLALVSPIANAVYAAGGDIRACARDRRIMGLMVDAVREGFRALRASGGRVEPARLAALMSLPKALLAPAFASRLASPWGETVIARHALKARAEMRCLSEDLLGIADRGGSPAPALRELARLAESGYPEQEG